MCAASNVWRTHLDLRECLRLRARRELDASLSLPESSELELDSLDARPCTAWPSAAQRSDDAMGGGGCGTHRSQRLCPHADDVAALEGKVPNLAALSARTTILGMLPAFHAS